MQFFVGGYAREGRSGIGVITAGAADDGHAHGQLRTDADAVTAQGSPSWLSWHPRLDVVYAALEDAGAVQAFRRTGQATLAPLGPPVPAGELACHVAVAPDGGALVASCWGDGRVVRYPLDGAGRIGRGVAAATASDPWHSDAEELALLFSRPDEGLASEREPAPDARPSRAHQARYFGDGRVLTTDMGFDLVRVWRDTPGGLRPVSEVVLPRGSGPRHTALHPSGYLFVLTELSREVFVLGADASGAWRLIGGVPLVGTLDGDTSAEIALDRSGEHVYVGVRGSNSIATLAVTGDGSVLSLTALSESGVDKPRHHVVTPGVLLVAGQSSGEVASLSLDPRTGVPGRARWRTEARSPSCLLPVR